MPAVIEGTTLHVIRIAPDHARKMEVRTVEGLPRISWHTQVLGSPC